MFVCLRFALSSFQIYELEWEAKHRIMLLRVKLIIHNRKDKGNPRTNILPILSETP